MKTKRKVKRRTRRGGAEIAKKYSIIPEEEGFLGLSNHREAKEYLEKNGQLKLYKDDNKFIYDIYVKNKVELQNLYPSLIQKGIKAYERYGQLEKGINVDYSGKVIGQKNLHQY